jgi:short subunit dehydrogenase-like uncharacterized protein
MSLDKPAQRPLDVVLYGATGFVGRQTVEWMAQPCAGRALGAGGPECRAAGGGAQAARPSMPHRPRSSWPTRRTRRRWTPWPQPHPRGAEHRRAVCLVWRPLVAACVRHGTHYVDITGETPGCAAWLTAHHARRQPAHGTRIIPCAGFDSVPSDLGAWLAGAPRCASAGQTCVDAKASYTVRGGFNGGTLASALNMLDTGQASAAGRSRTC